MKVQLPPFGILVERHGNELLAHARRLSGDAAEDVLHDALIRALRAYPKLQHAEHLRAWLYRITTTTAFDHGRAKRDVPVAELPERAHEVSYDDGAFEELIGDLSEGSRRAMHLRFVDDLSYDQMAKRLGCTPEAARQRVSTAVRALRKEMS